MTKEKQIEEMAKVIINTKNDVKVWERLKTDEDIAEAFYNAGYRKASEVAREVFEEIEEEIRSSVEVIITIKDEEEDGWYDGQLNVLGMLGNFIAKLKKKYTETEKVNE